MCMIAYRPHGRGNIPNAVIDTAQSRHPDGFGLMYRDEYGLHVQSWAPHGRKAFRKALRRVDRLGVEYAAHFRFATSGPKNVDMAHPYTYEDPDPEVGTVAVMHNGVISIAHDRSAESDTSAFVRLVLARLPSRWWANPALVFLVKQSIGWSRLTLMTATETVNMHEDDGTWDNGIWYSSDHRPSKSYASSGSKQYGHWDNDAQKWVSYDTSPSATAKDTTAKDTTAKDTSTTKYPAAKSAAALGLLAPTTGVFMREDAQSFRHAGHNLTAIREIDVDGGDADYEDAVICDSCETVGTVYVIDGTYYIDMAHRSGDDEVDEDGDSYDLLPTIEWAQRAH